MAHPRVLSKNSKIPPKSVLRYFFRESETTIKIKFALLRGGGVGRGAEGKIVPNAIFMGNVMTIKF